MNFTIFGFFKDSGAENFFVSYKVIGHLPSASGASRQAFSVIRCTVIKSYNKGIIE
jgi:hypothetical protein